MEKNVKPNDNSPDPINFDLEQLKELEKLIDSLKKEIVFPKRKPAEKHAYSKADQN